MSEVSHNRLMPTKIEWGILLALAVQVASWITTATKLAQSVETLNTTVATMSDYSVLRYRLEQSERLNIAQQAQIEQLLRRSR